MNHTVRIDLAYDGAAFHGWQAQPGLRTAQGVLTHEVERLMGHEVRLFGAGRTDRGVHALAQVAHVPDLNEIEVRRLIRTLPRMGPADMHIKNVREVSTDFHARYSAFWRRYEYRLMFEDDLFQRGTRCFIGDPLDREAMDEACAHIRGRHDFRSFCKTMSWKKDNHCEVREAFFEWGGREAIFHIRADRFLHHMVRTLVGTIVEVGRGERVPDDMLRVLAAFDRSEAGIMAPPQGLFLAEVGYPDELMDPDFDPFENKNADDDVEAAGTAGAQPEETP